MANVLIVVPVYNEETAIPRLIEAFQRLQTGLVAEGDRARLFFVDDGSTDATHTTLSTLLRDHPADIRRVRLAGNCGQRMALNAGLSGVDDWPDVVITMDADLEQPIELIPDMLACWRQSGVLIVNAIRRSCRRLPLLKRLLSRAYYALLRIGTDLEIEDGQADFRLWDARLVRQLKPYWPLVSSQRVFAAWLRCPKAKIHYDQRVTVGRVSRFTFRKNLDLVIASVVRYSSLPFQLVLLSGIVGFAVAVTYGVYVCVQYARGVSVAGWSSIVLCLLFFNSLILLCLATLAEYLRRLVFSKDLPPFIVAPEATSPPDPPAGGRP
jgi:polyisoprenyl-phosphate glycosyltransferase